jgi:hypothetical protein
MSVSARLSVKTRSALERYCKHRGVTKTQALEQGIQLLLESAEESHHAAYLSFVRLKDRLPRDRGDSVKSSAAIKRHLDAKYPG